MPKGVITFYSERRGYGFISRDDSGTAVESTPGTDVYVHYSQIQGLRSPHEGLVVTFEVKEGDRGPEAVNVRTAS